MPDTYWYIVSCNGSRPVSIWRRGWGKISRDAYRWHDRSRAKKSVAALRRRFPSKTLRLMSGAELEPWFVGEALEPKSEIIAMYSPYIPLQTPVSPK